MTIQSKIDALPEWAKTPSDSVWYTLDNGKAALARLALLRAWVAASTHHYFCPRSPTQIGNTLVPCDCGRDALLAATEVPK